MLTIISSYNLVCQSVQYLLQSTVEYSVCYNIIYTSCGNKINTSVESTPQTTKVQLTLYVTDIGEKFTVALTRCQSCLLLLDFKLFLDRFNQHFRSYILMLQVCNFFLCYAFVIFEDLRTGNIYYLNCVFNSCEIIKSVYIVSKRKHITLWGSKAGQVSRQCPAKMTIFPDKLSVCWSFLPNTFTVNGFECIYSKL